MRLQITRLISTFLLAILASVSFAADGAPPYTKPKVRAITGFVRLDRGAYEKEITEALSVLRSAKAEFEKRGYQVETLRIVTQPLAELVSGQSDAEALKFLKALDDLSVKESFMPNVGPGMMSDTDEPRTMHLLAQMLSTLPNIPGGHPNSSTREHLKLLHP